MDNAFYAAVFVDDDQRRYFLFFHEGQSGGGELIFCDGLGIASHGFGGGEIHDVFATFFQEAAKVSVADDADQTLVVDDGGDSQLLAGHLVDDVGHFGGWGNARKSLAGMHERFHAGQTFAQLASGMEVGKIFFLESAALAESDGESVAQSEHGGGGGGRRQAERTGFLSDGTIQGYVGGSG